MIENVYRWWTTLERPAIKWLEGKSDPFLKGALLLAAGVLAGVALAPIGNAWKAGVLAWILLP